MLEKNEIDNAIINWKVFKWFICMPTKCQNNNRP